MRTALSMLVAFAVTIPATAADDYGLTKGAPELQSAGALTFGPDGILFVADAKSAAIFAIDTGDKKGDSSRAINVEKVDAKIAAMLGTTADEILINDLAVNPATGSAYISVSRGRGPDAQPVLVRVSTPDKVEMVSLKDVPFAKATLPNAPEDREQGQGRRRSNPRGESITDLAYDEGRVVVAGLSNEEFASKLRTIPFPFESVDGGASVEIYHAAHGQYETRSPVRTFAMFRIDDEPHVVAAYTCTPLVTFPLSDLSKDAAEKIRGTTVAELGNRNRPLDMIVYSKGDQRFLFMANSARGVMKVSTKGIEQNVGLTEPVRGGGTAGQTYETIEGLQGVVQLDKLNDSQALLLVEAGGSQNLKTYDLP